MTDVLSKEQRSYNMSRIRGKWTAPEMKLHNFMKSYKIKHVMHPDIVGRPDAILKDAKVAVFVDSCFFHKCPLCFREPTSNTDYWLPKIERNVKRDRRNTKALQGSGWKVARLWEHEIKKDIRSCIDKIVKEADLQVETKNGSNQRANSLHAASSKYLVIDLCCGMGGLSLAAKNIGMKPIAGVDINQHALKTYSKNFPGTVTIDGDISEKSTQNLFMEVWKSKNDGKHLAVVSGPPCQGFSVAGPRNPNDPRNDVLVYVAEAIASVKPSFALIENVSAVLSPRNSSRIKKLKRILSRAGYNVLAIKMNALDFGVPQRRLRAFFFITKNKLDEATLEEILSVMHREKKTVGDALKGLPKPKVRPVIYVDDNESHKIPNHFAMRHSEKVKRKIADIKQGDGPLSYRKLDPEKPAKTLISGHRAPPAHPFEPRSLTIREVARLQGFPDTFRVYGKFGRQMEQVTNAVPPSLGEAALSAILQFAG